MVRDGYTANQSAQDINAESAGESVAVGRALVKAGKMYNNTNRCLVDTFQRDKSILKKVKEEELPEVLRKLAPEKREAYVKQLATKRSEVQKQIAKQATEREAYLAKQRKLQADSGSEATLGDAVVAAIAKQLAKSGFNTPTKSN